MLVKAKWSVKDGTGWHHAGEVFNTESDLGDAVEVLETPRKPAPKKAEVKEPEKVAEAPAAEPEKAEAAKEVKPRTTRRKVSK